MHSTLPGARSSLPVAWQAKAFLDLPEQRLAGLNLINQQDLCYFQPVHQAELFRLKGIFLQVGPAFSCIQHFCAVCSCQLADAQ